MNSILIVVLTEKIMYENMWGFPPAYCKTGNERLNLTVRCEGLGLQSLSPARNPMVQ